MTRYSMGFMVSPDGESILLLRKVRPDWLSGTWQGVGGHIEPGETALEAMSRESIEEAEIDSSRWHFIKQLEGPLAKDCEINVFVGVADITAARALTDEPVQVYKWSELDGLNLGHSTIEVLPQLRNFAASLSLSASPRTPTLRR